MGVGCYFLYYFTVQFNHIYCVYVCVCVCVCACVGGGGSKLPFVTFQIFSLELTMEGSHPSLYTISIYILIQVL